MKRHGAANLTIVLAIGGMSLLAVAMLCGTFLVWFLFSPQDGGADPDKPKARLAELVPDSDSRARLEAFFDDFALVLTQDDKPCKTTGDFRTAYRRAVVSMKSAARLPDVKAIDEPISNRIAAAIGKADTNLDGEPPLRTNLAAVLTSIADDFGGR